MIYTVKQAKEFWPTFVSLVREPRKAFFSVVPDRDGRVLILRGLFGGVKEVPEGCVLVDTRHRGGTMLVFPDGVTLAAITDKSPGWLTRLTDYLKSRGLDAKIDKNDVLVDGYKVAGMAVTPFGPTQYAYCGLHVSVNVDVDLITRVCGKPEKMPRGLSEYGITRQDILTALDIEEGDDGND